VICFLVVDVYGRWGKYTCSCIMSILVMSICIEPGRWESHITIPECSRARSVKKLYDYSGVLLWIMSPLAGRNRTGTASYVARGGVRCSFIPCWVWRQWTCICIALHSLRFIYIEVLCWQKWIWGALFLFIWGVLLYSYVEVVYLLHIMPFTLWKFYWISCIRLFTSLCQCHWINKLIISYYFHLVYIPLLLNRCLIKL